MITYIAFLRGINVSGQKKIKMVDLRESLQKAGFEGVRSYIQSGNLILKTKLTVEKKVAAIVQVAIKRDFGFEVPILIKTLDSLDSILLNNPFKQVAEKKNQYFTLLHEIPEQKLVKEFAKLHFTNEDFQLVNACVYLNCKQGAGKAKLNNNLIESKLMVTATTRNLNTMQKMLLLAAEG